MDHTIKPGDRVTYYPPTQPVGECIHFDGIVEALTDKRIKVRFASKVSYVCERNLNVLDQLTLLP